ncbi:DUF3089 domain-containing protein [Phenylobacterium conjunctum]|uniref:DUF3089 domain-containing protein n=1 Tax=Phenylobacterium conjunctum TaxID=1298959 RepID=A0ABW3T7Z4_9CAUL
MSRTLLAAVAAGLISLSAQAQAQAPADPPKNDYGDKANWLCLPGRADACAADNTTTVIAADGKMTREAWTGDPKAPVDCFYVYPTVSNDPGVISDMVAGPEEISVVTSQLNRLGAKCRIFAPLYRQFTLTALRAAVAGGPAASAARPNTGYLDVVDAWNWYLAHENKSRGVVLIGHSQGSGVLTQLIAKEIDGKPAQKLLVSAILGGTSLPVDKGKDTGTFKSIPTCKSAGQVGCVIAWASFRDTVPPPANTRFGRPRDLNPAMEAVCTNPAALAGGSAPLHAYLGTTTNGQDAAAWVKGGAKVETPFVSVPGLLTGACVSKNGFNYLEVHVNADPADPRTDDIKGDVVYGTQVAQDWGLHLIDMNLVMGDLVTVVGAETKTWLKH